MIGLVIGNGESRKGIDLDLYTKNYDVVFGCNALYRDFSPDILFVGDQKILDEIKENYSGKVAFYRRRNNPKLIINNIEIQTPADNPSENINWYSGIMAAWAMCAFTDVKNIDLLGFDVYSLDGRVNNLYKDTNGYFSSQENHEIALNTNIMIKSMKVLVFEKFPNIKFTWLGSILPLDWQFNNVSRRDLL